MFCSVFSYGSDGTIVRVKRSAWVTLATFVKSKRRLSAPSRGRIHVVSELLYQSLKNGPDGTRCKKVIFKSTVILLLITYKSYVFKVFRVLSKIIIDSSNNCVSSILTWRRRDYFPWKNKVDMNQKNWFRSFSNYKSSECRRFFFIN